MNLRSTTCILMGLVASTTVAFAANPKDPNGNAASQSVASSGPYATIPLEDWSVDPKSFISKLKQTRAHGVTKAATDLATVYRPVPVCRLIDTRGNPAAIAIAGPLGPNTTTNVNSAGFCGIPNNGFVAGISLSFHVLNLTVNNGGFISFLQQGAPISGTNAVFNPGAQWTAATANVSIPNDSGNFEMYIANSQVHVIVDVNGYYQDMDEVDVGTQELDISGATTGDLFEVRNAAAGSALSLDNFSGGPAITIYSGKFRVSGASGTNTSGPVLTHTVNTAAFGSGGTICGGFPAWTIIDHPFANNTPTAVLFVQANAQSAVSSISSGPFELEYLPTSSSCSPALAVGHWAIHDRGGAAHVNGAKFNVMIVTP